MSFGVYGRKPSSEAGACFFTSCWTWRPIVFLIEEACGELLDKRTLVALGCNGGVGPTSQDVCDEMASRLQRILSNCSESEFTRIQRPTILQFIGRRNSISPYRVSRDRVQEFVLFLQDCGGFYVIQMAFVSFIYSLAFFNTPWHRVRAVFRQYPTKPFTILELSLRALCGHGVAA